MRITGYPHDLKLLLVGADLCLDYWIFSLIQIYGLGCCYCLVTKVF